MTTSKRGRRRYERDDEQVKKLSSYGFHDDDNEDGNEDDNEDDNADDNTDVFDLSKTKTDSKLIDITGSGRGMFCILFFFVFVVAYIKICVYFYNEQTQ